MLTFKHSKETITLEIKATKDKDPMTPANNVDPRHTESSPSYKSSEKMINLEEAEQKKNIRSVDNHKT